MFRRLGFIRGTRETISIWVSLNEKWVRLTLTLVTEEGLSGNKRPKWFHGGLLAAASAIGSLFSIGLSAANSVSLSTLQRHMGEIDKEMPEIQQRLVLQQEQLQNLGKTLQGTIVTVNLHSALLNNTTQDLVRNCERRLNVCASSQGLNAGPHEGSELLSQQLKLGKDPSLSGLPRPCRKNSNLQICRKSQLPPRLCKLHKYTWHIVLAAPSLFRLTQRT